MSRLALNFSPQAADLAAAGSIDFEVFKVPGDEDLIAAAKLLRPCRVHFPFQIGAITERPEVERAAELLQLTGGAAFNVHVAPAAERFPDLAIAAVGEAALTLVAGALLADLAPGLERFGPENVLIENLIYRGEERGLLRAGVEPATLHTVVSDSGCGLLLDISHARISAATLGLDPWEYLDALPTHALRELHVSGVGPLDGQLRDHLPFAEDDWAFLSGVSGRIKAGAWPAPELVTFDYGGVGPVFNWRSDEYVLAEQVPRLGAWLAELGSAA